MTIKFEKEIELSGQTWYKIWNDDTCLRAFLDTSGNSQAIMQEAQAYYKDVVRRAKNGFPVKETLAEETITPKP